jgi:hypothetical protein
MRAFYLSFSILISSFATGCAGFHICDPTTLLSASRQAAGTVVVELTTDSPVFSIPDLDQALADGLADSGVANDVLERRTLGTMGAPQPAYLVTFALRRYHAMTSSAPPGGIAVLSLSWLIVPVAFVGLVRQHTEHMVEFDVEVRDLRGAQLVLRAEQTGAVPDYDVSMIPPILRRSFRVEMRSARNWIRAESSHDRGYHSQTRAVATELATRMVNESLGTFTQAIALGARSPVVLVEPAVVTPSEPVVGAPAAY